MLIVSICSVLTPQPFAVSGHDATVEKTSSMIWLASRMPMFCATANKKRLVSSNTHEADYNRRILLIFLILRTQLANGLTGTPHLLVAHSLQFLLQTGTIVGLRVGIDSDLSLITSLH